MEEPIKTTEKDESKSFSILRQFLRFAISSIVYHRIAAGGGGQRERDRTCSGTGGNDNESSDLFRNERVQTEIEKEIAKVPSPAKNNTIPSPSLSPAFVDKDYCGIKGLKFMDAVAHDGTVVDSNGTHTSFTYNSTRFMFMFILISMVSVPCKKCMP
jgi:hypothetical protein